MNPKEIKQEIRQLRRLKLKCKPGIEERLELEHKIKALKKQLVELTKPEPEKDPIIAEILKYKELSIFDKEYYQKFSVEQLTKHLENLKEKIK